MFKRNWKKILISSLVILLPVLAGLILWGRLPERIPTHWNASGAVDGWSGRGMAVFGIPAIILAGHLLCVGATFLDPKNKDQSDKIVGVVVFIMPVVSTVTMGAMYATALGAQVNIMTWVLAAVSVIFIVLGNYLPKCKRNYTVGIKVPWTMDSEEVWTATHRMAGRLWVAGGFVMLGTSFLPGSAALWAFFAEALVLALAPVGYSVWKYSRVK